MNTTLPPLQAKAHLFKDRTGRQTKLLAFVDLTIADAFVIRGIRVLARNVPGDDAPFVVFPAEKGADADQQSGPKSDRWYDLAHPVTAEARAAALRVILHAYSEAVAARP
ncbi:MAG: septation protein SpoVG family protein [Elusimicrobia bacterium]|nr:septation protein SpoVG family protein [Elusimicrobiota bacterium]